MKVDVSKRAGGVAIAICVCALAAATAFAGGKAGHANDAAGDKYEKTERAKRHKYNAAEIAKKRDERKQRIQEKARERVEKRQEHQAKRIEHGVKRGYLTEEEIAKLKAQQEEIAQMETAFQGDGKLSRDEAKQLSHALKSASLLIWTEKHDYQGETMSVYRLGKDVVVHPDVASKLQDPNLTREEARTFVKDFRRTLELKRKLADPELEEAERAELQAEYNGLLDKYFIVNTI